MASNSDARLKRTVPTVGDVGKEPPPGLQWCTVRYSKRLHLYDRRERFVLCGLGLYRSGLSVWESHDACARCVAKLGEWRQGAGERVMD